MKKKLEILKEFRAKQRNDLLGLSIANFAGFKVCDIFNRRSLPLFLVKRKKNPKSKLS